MHYQNQPFANSMAHPKSKSRIEENCYEILRQLADLRDALAACATKSTVTSTSEDTCEAEEVTDSTHESEVANVIATEFELSPQQGDTDLLEAINSFTPTEIQVFDENPQGDSSNKPSPIAPIAGELSPITIMFPISKLVIADGIVLPPVISLDFEKNFVNFIADKLFAKMLPRSWGSQVFTDMSTGVNFADICPHQNILWPQYAFGSHLWFDTGQPSSCIPLTDHPTSTSFLFSGSAFALVDEHSGHVTQVLAEVSTGPLEANCSPHHNFVWRPRAFGLHYWLETGQKEIAHLPWDGSDKIAHGINRIIVAHYLSTSQLKVGASWGVIGVLDCLMVMYRWLNTEPSAIKVDGSYFSKTTVRFVGFRIITFPAHHILHHFPFDPGADHFTITFNGTLIITCVWGLLFIVHGEFPIVLDLGFRFHILYGLAKGYGPDHTYCLWEPKWYFIPPGKKLILKARRVHICSGMFIIFLGATRNCEFLNASSSLKYVQLIPSTLWNFCFAPLKLWLRNLMDLFKWVGIGWILAASKFFCASIACRMIDIYVYVKSNWLDVEGCSLIKEITDTNWLTVIEFRVLSTICYFSFSGRCKSEYLIHSEHAINTPIQLRDDNSDLKFASLFLDCIHKHELDIVCSKAWTGWYLKFAKVGFAAYRLDLKAAIGVSSLPFDPGIQFISTAYESTASTIRKCKFARNQIVFWDMRDSLVLSLFSSGVGMVLILLQFDRVLTPLCALLYLKASLEGYIWVVQNRVPVAAVDIGPIFLSTSTPGMLHVLSQNKTPFVFASCNGRVTGFAYYIGDPGDEELDICGMIYLIWLLLIVILRTLQQQQDMPVLTKCSTEMVEYVNANILEIILPCQSAKKVLLVVIVGGYDDEQIIKDFSANKWSYLISLPKPFTLLFTGNPYLWDYSVPKGALGVALGIIPQSYLLPEDVSFFHHQGGNICADWSACRLYIHCPVICVTLPEP